MKCQQVPLLEFLRSELEAEQIERTLEHLEGCSECRERLQVIIRLSTIEAGRRTPRKTSRMWLIAAALLLAVSIPVLYIGFPACLRDSRIWPAWQPEKNIPTFPSKHAPTKVDPDRRHLVQTCANEDSQPTTTTTSPKRYSGFKRKHPMPKFCSTRGSHSIFANSTTLLSRVWKERSSGIQNGWNLPSGTRPTFS